MRAQRIGDVDAIRDQVEIATTYDELRRFKPNTILSTHLPPAPGQPEAFPDFLEVAPQTTTFVGPDQAAMEATLQQALGATE